MDDAAGVGDFVTVNAEAYAVYGMPSDVIADMFDRPDAVLADPALAMVVAYREEAPVAAALVYVSDGTASLQWVGTRSEARGLRLGEAVTVWTTNEAFERGAGSCTLQASVMGAPLYRKLGYETLYRYAEYVRWSGARSGRRRGGDPGPGFAPGAESQRRPGAAARRELPREATSHVPWSRSEARRPSADCSSATAGLVMRARSAPGSDSGPLDGGVGSGGPALRSKTGALLSSPSSSGRT